MSNMYTCEEHELSPLPKPYKRDSELARPQQISSIKSCVFIELSFSNGCVFIELTFSNHVRNVRICGVGGGDPCKNTSMCN